MGTTTRKVGATFMPSSQCTLETLWADAGFSPNAAQRQAILHADGPLFLPAGPGSGKTRVLLWRTLNLIVFHGVAPEQIYLSTFTEKAARQLKDGLRALLGQVTAATGVPYDTGRMYVGTVHSLCQRLLLDRRFHPDRDRGTAPALLDDLDQYLWLARSRAWRELLTVGGFGEDAHAEINGWFEDKPEGSASKHVAVTNCLSLFNRLSEECVVPVDAMRRTDDPMLVRLLRVYTAYRERLETEGATAQTDFSLLQQHALRLLEGAPNAGGDVFRHVVIDEYQDTNAVQERIFFRLAAGTRNLCVVGDDDQALYRFRGATVENFVEFAPRCQAKWGCTPTAIPLVTNYRSRRRIVDFYGAFVDRCDWAKTPPASGHHRVVDKQIEAHSTDAGPAVVASTPGTAGDVCAEVAQFVQRLLREGKVTDPNQVAFLYPSLKSPHVQRQMAALEAVGLRVYAPRARSFLDGDEVTAMLGLFTRVLGRPPRGDFRGMEYAGFHDWLDRAEDVAERLCDGDPALAAFVNDRRDDVETARDDWRWLAAVATERGWALDAPYDAAMMKRALHGAAGLSGKAKRTLGSAYFDRLVRERAAVGRPYPLGYVLKRATSVEWSLLDLFWRLCGFDHFRAMFDAAHRPTDPDEGPVSTLSLLSQYVGRFVDRRAPLLTGELLQDGGAGRLFFASYCYALFRRGEGEYEDAEDPFPKGRIPFLTVHQAKGLEFPVVVLGNLRKDDKGPTHLEKTVRPLLDRDGEPLTRVAEFDIMRMFYVALSRAKHLLVLAHYKGAGQRINKPFADLLGPGTAVPGGAVPRIPAFDTRPLPAAGPDGDALPRSYSYTADYLHYQRCPRQYMIFREYDFVPSRSQTMLFGTLVHRTMDDLHQWLIARRQTP